MRKKDIELRQEIEQLKVLMQKLRDAKAKENDVLKVSRKLDKLIIMCLEHESRAQVVRQAKDGPYSGWESR